MKKITILIIFVLTFNFSFSQSDVVQFMQAGTEDANKLIKAYMNPFAMALGDGLNRGWYYTAETHKRFGFDFSMSISSVRVPESARTFDMSKLNLSDVVIDPMYGSIAPTAAGLNEAGPKLNLLDPNNSGDTIGSFRSPPGTDVNLIPVPVAQLGIGLLPHTDILLRYVPKLSFNQQDENQDKVRVGILGFGVKHNFKDWMPVLKHLPFDAAVLASYTNVTANGGVQFGLSDYGQGYNDNRGGYVPDDNQKLDMTTNTMKVELVVSKKVAFITFFGGIGNSRSNTEVNLLGRYPIIVDVQNNEPVVVDEVDPIKLEYESSRISMDAGVRMKLGYFNIFTSINKAEYSSFNFGASISVR